VARSSFATTDLHSIFARLTPRSRGVVHPETLAAIPSTPRKRPWGERMNGGSARGRSVIALGESRPLRGRRGREGRERAQCARSARVVSGEGIVPAPASQVGRENPGLAALAGVLGTTANIGWNASRCFAPLATLAVKGVDRERRGHPFARLTPGSRGVVHPETLTDSAATLARSRAVAQGRERSRPASWAAERRGMNGYTPPRSAAHGRRRGVQRFPWERDHREAMSQDRSAER